MTPEQRAALQRLGRALEGAEAAGQALTLDIGHDEHGAPTATLYRGDHALAWDYWPADPTAQARSLEHTIDETHTAPTPPPRFQRRSKK